MLYCVTPTKQKGQSGAVKMLYCVTPTKQKGQSDAVKMSMVLILIIKKRVSRIL